MPALQPTLADLDRVASILAEAFFADPLWGWAFSDARTRRRQHFDWFKLVVAQAIENESAWVSPHFESAAIWVVPGKTELNQAREEELAANLRETCSDADLLFELFELFEQHHPHDQDLHYLSLLGTADAHRGHGLAMRLLRERLRELDEIGAPAYLESTNPANLPRYEAVGFRPHGSFQLTPEAPLVTTMWREPHRSSDG